VIDKSEPKYMNTTETVAYSKRRVLYGLNLAKKTKRPNMILCEGNLDVVTLHQAGFDNAVACMGTALTQEQIRLLSRFTKELVLCYDNDNAGQQATRRALELLNNSEFSVKVLQLPRRLVDGEYIKQDADDFIKFQGPAAFERLLTGSENGVEFRLDQIAGRYDLTDDAQRIAYAQEVSEELAKLENAVEREVYTTRAAQAAGLTPEAMRLEVERTLRRKLGKERKALRRRELNPAVSVQPQERGIRYTNVRSAMAEEGVLFCLMKNPDSYPQVSSRVSEQDFVTDINRQLYLALSQRLEQGQTVEMIDLSSQLSPELMGRISAIMATAPSQRCDEQTLGDYIARLIEHRSVKTEREVAQMDDNDLGEYVKQLAAKKNRRS
jgi:DNA primase